MPGTTLTPFVSDQLQLLIHLPNLIAMLGSPHVAHLPALLYASTCTLMNMVIAERRAAASEARLMMVSHSRFCYIYIYVYMSAPYTGRCYSLMAAPCAEWHMPRSTLFSGFLHSVTFLPQVVRSQSICFRHSRRALFPALCCALGQRAVASCSASVSSADSHSELSISTNAG